MKKQTAQAVTLFCGDNEIGELLEKAFRSFVRIVLVHADAVAEPGEH